MMVRPTGKLANWALRRPTGKLANCVLARARAGAIRLRFLPVASSQFAS
jgi:hypothetical protein